MADGSDIDGRTVVTHDEQRHRFEIALDGQTVGVADYRDVGGTRHFVHTEVDPAYGGRGLAGVLVGQALTQARADRLHVVPVCSYVAHYIAKHPEFRDLVD